MSRSAPPIVTEQRLLTSWTIIATKIRIYLSEIHNASQALWIAIHCTGFRAWTSASGTDES